LHGDNVAFTIIGNKFSGEVLGNATNYGALSAALEPEAGAHTKLGDCECPQAGDMTDEDVPFLLHDGASSEPKDARAPAVREPRQ